MREGTTDTLFVGYAPSFQGWSDWRLDFRQSRPGEKDSVIRRTVWQHATERKRRLIVEVGEYRNQSDANGALDLATREAGVKYALSPLGAGSLAYPEDHPTSIYVIRANLVIWVVSNGWEAIDVEPLVKAVLHELDHSWPTNADKHLMFIRHAEWQDPRGADCLEFKPEWDFGESAWLKFTASGATLERAPEAHCLLVWPETPGHQYSVTGWLIEPGRETYVGRYS